MFKVIKKPKTPNIIWDSSNNRPLCRFVNGVIKTNDKTLVSKLKNLGYAVEGETNSKALNEMKVDELKVYATEHNIDLGNVKNKADILKTIHNAKK